MTKHSVKTALAAAVVTLVSSSAFAGANYILPGQVQNTNSGVTLDLVRSDSPGTVYAYDAREGVDGKVLGTAPVHAGANTDVRITFSRPALRDVLTVLYSGSGATVATAEVTDK